MKAMLSSVLTSSIPRRLSRWQRIALSVAALWLVTGTAFVYGIEEADCGDGYPNP
jgi:hypothetical protein